MNLSSLYSEILDTRLSTLRKSVILQQVIIELKSEASNLKVGTRLRTNKEAQIESLSLFLEEITNGTTKLSSIGLRIIEELASYKLKKQKEGFEKWLNSKK
tara:strand:+ start:526 stop:828 length:303 start_codon:yes stop_codon:yes gene_type:complete